MAGFFGNVGIPPELAVPIALLKVNGGIVLMLGILTRIDSILFIVEMIRVTLIIKLGNCLTGEGGY